MLENLRLTVIQNGATIRSPELLSDVGLRETLLNILDFDEAGANFICRYVEEHGTYEIGHSFAHPKYRFEKICQS